MKKTDQKILEEIIRVDHRGVHAIVETGGRDVLTCIFHDIDSWEETVVSHCMCRSKKAPTKI